MAFREMAELCLGRRLPSKSVAIKMYPLKFPVSGDQILQ